MLSATALLALEGDSDTIMDLNRRIHSQRHGDHQPLDVEPGTDQDRRRRYSSIVFASSESGSANISIFSYHLSSSDSSVSSDKGPLGLTGIVSANSHPCPLVRSN